MQFQFINKEISVI